MNWLPRSLSGIEVVQALRRVEFYMKRQKGSHMVLRRDDPFAQVVVPVHRSIDTGTLAAILDGAGLTAQEFFASIVGPAAILVGVGVLRYTGRI